MAVDGALCAVAAAVVAACAAAVVARAQDVAPSTALDPPAWAPPASDAPATGAPVGVRRSGRADEARRIVRRFLEALAARDVGALEALTADPLTRYEGGLTWPRADLLPALLRGAESRGLGRGTDVAAYADLAHALVVPVELRPGSRLRHGDLVVTATLRARPGQPAPPGGSLYFEHANLVRLIVRLPPDGRVVGL